MCSGGEIEVSRYMLVSKCSPEPVNVRFSMWSTGKERK